MSQRSGEVIQSAAKFLVLNAGAQILFSTGLGTLMLLPMQPWFIWRAPGKLMKEIGAAHIDWFMLAFMQCTAATILQTHVNPSTPNAEKIVPVIAQMLAFGGWMNPTTYVLRGFGIDAFVLDVNSSKTQKAGALLGALSASCVLLGWVGIFRLLYVQGEFK